MELFHVIKKQLYQYPVLNFQKCYEHKQNMTTGDWGPRTNERIIGPGVWGQTNLVAEFLRQFVSHSLTLLFITKMDRYIEINSMDLQ